MIAGRITIKFVAFYFKFFNLNKPLEYSSLKIWSQFNAVIFNYLHFGATINQKIVIQMYTNLFLTLKLITNH